MDVGEVDHRRRERMVTHEQGDVAQGPELRLASRRLQAEGHPEVGDAGSDVVEGGHHPLVDGRGVPRVRARVAHHDLRPQQGGQVAGVVEGAEVQREALRLGRRELREVRGVDREADPLAGGDGAEAFGLGLLQRELLDELDLTGGVAPLHHPGDRPLEVLGVLEAGDSEAHDSHRVSAPLNPASLRPIPVCSGMAMTTPRRLLVVLTILTVLIPSAGPVLAATAARTKPWPPPPPVRYRAPVHVAPPAPPVPPPPPPGPDGNPLPAPLGVDEGILVDTSNGKVLWEVNDNQPRPPASLTKILTALVVLQRAGLDDTQTVTDEAYNAPGANTYAKPGWTYSVDDMLWGLLLVSGNDMAISLAQRVSPDGTMAGFVQLMNEQAAALGATSTVMVNPHGMDAPGHVSTARDLALLTMVAMRVPTFATMVGTVQHAIPWDGGQHTHPLVNHNKLLTLYPGTIGVKTGYTNGSGNSLASEATHDGHTLLAIVLNAKSPAGYNDSKALYDWGFLNFDALEARATDVIVPLTPSSTMPAATKKAGDPVAEAVARAVPGSRPLRDAIPLDNVLIGVLIASVIGAWFLSHRRGVNEAYRGGGARSSSVDL